MDKRLVNAYDRMTMPEDCTRRTEKNLHTVPHRGGDGRFHAGSARPSKWEPAAAAVCVLVLLMVGALTLFGPLGNSRGKQLAAAPGSEQLPQELLNVCREPETLARMYAEAWIDGNRELLEALSLYGVPAVTYTGDPEKTALQSIDAWDMMPEGEAVVTVRFISLETPGTSHHFTVNMEEKEGYWMVSTGKYTTQDAHHPITLRYSNQSRTTNGDSYPDLKEMAAVAALAWIYGDAETIDAYVTGPLKVFQTYDWNPNQVAISNVVVADKPDWDTHEGEGKFDGTWIPSEAVVQMISLEDPHLLYNLHLKIEDGAFQTFAADTVQLSMPLDGETVQQNGLTSSQTKAIKEVAREFFGAWSYGNEERVREYLLPGLSFDGESYPGLEERRKSEKWAINVEAETVRKTETGEVEVKITYVDASDHGPHCLTILLAMQEDGYRVRSYSLEKVEYE